MADQLHFVLIHLSDLLIGFPGQRPGGLLMSLLLALIAVTAGFLLGNLVGAMQRSRWRMVRWLCRGYVEIFRGLPLLVLLLLVYQVVGGGRFGLELSPHTAAAIALTLYSGAYQAEILRAGLVSVPQQLSDTARVTGGSLWQAYRWIELPYALRVMFPALVGQAISLFKDTSVVIIIGVADLMMVARVALGSDVTNAPYWVTLYLAVGFLYFCVAFSLSLLARRWEQHQQLADLVHSMARQRILGAD